MTLPVLLSLLWFALVQSLTPGPNNTMVLSSSVQFGIRRTLPHIAGVAFGFITLLLCIGMGLGTLTIRFPFMLILIKSLGAVYLLWMAWRLWTMPPANPLKSDITGHASSQSHPLTFFGAALFQWVNPKAWIACTTAVATYTDPFFFWVSLAPLVVVFVFSVFIGLMTWAIFGILIKKWLLNPLFHSLFNKIMAFSLIMSLWPILYL